jgi:hypothetical protein
MAVWLHRFKPLLFSYSLPSLGCESCCSLCWCLFVLSWPGRSFLWWLPSYGHSAGMGSRSPSASTRYLAAIVSFLLATTISNVRLTPTPPSRKRQSGVEIFEGRGSRLKTLRASKTLRVPLRLLGGHWVKPTGVKRMTAANPLYG